MTLAETTTDTGGMAPLDYLFWRDELLQVLYWMLGEGLGEHPSAAQIEAFLVADTDDITRTLVRMVEDGYVVATNGGFQLTPLGQAEGKRSFREEFEALTHSSHGDCGPDCTFCHGPDGNPSECPSKMGTHSHAGAAH